MTNLYQSHSEPCLHATKTRFPECVVLCQLGGLYLCQAQSDGGCTDPNDLRTQRFSAFLRVPMTDPAALHRCETVCIDQMLEPWPYKRANLSKSHSWSFLPLGQRPT